MSLLKLDSFAVFCMRALLISYTNATTPHAFDTVKPLFRDVRNEPSVLPALAVFLQLGTAPIAEDD